MLLDAARLAVGHPFSVYDEPNAAHEAVRRFAASLREARRRYGAETGQGDLTQKQFAQMLGISGDRPEERYRLYESGKREPPLWILVALRRVTGYSLDDIIAQLPAGRRLHQEPRQRLTPTLAKGPEPPRPTLGVAGVPGRLLVRRARQANVETLPAAS